MSGSKTSVIVQAGSQNAALMIAVKGKYLVAFGQNIVVFGENFSGFGNNVFTRSLPGISVPAIVTALNNPGAKHTMFRGKGNKYSRIAWLVQAGYGAALTQAFEPPPSGVKFSWTAKDLGNYIEKWVGRMGASGAYAGLGVIPANDAAMAKSNADSVFRELAASATLVHNYTYTSDTTLTVTSDKQEQAQNDYAEKQGSSAGGSKRMIAL